MDCSKQGPPPMQHEIDVGVEFAQSILGTKEYRKLGRHMHVDADALKATLMASHTLS